MNVWAKNEKVVKNAFCGPILLGKDFQIMDQLWSVHIIYDINIDIFIDTDLDLDIDIDPG